jgi:hypothetical protein
MTIFMRTGICIKRARFIHPILIHLSKETPLYQRCIKSCIKEKQGSIENPFPNRGSLFDVYRKETLRKQETPLGKRSGGYFYRIIVKLTTDTLYYVDSE